jgi:hypothetical protein
MGRYGGACADSAPNFVSDSPEVTPAILGQPDGKWLYRAKGELRARNHNQRATPPADRAMTLDLARCRADQNAWSRLGESAGATVPTIARGQRVRASTRP